VAPVTRALSPSRSRWPFIPGTFISGPFAVVSRGHLAEQGRSLPERPSSMAGTSPAGAPDWPVLWNVPPPAVRINNLIFRTAGGFSCRQWTSRPRAWPARRDALAPRGCTSVDATLQGLRSISPRSFMSPDSFISPGLFMSSASFMLSVSCLPSASFISPVSMFVPGTAVAPS
jgi:hypothetical protein